MVLPSVWRKSYVILFMCLLTMLLLAACSSATASSSTSGDTSTSSKPSTSASVGATPTHSPAVIALMKQMTFGGTPTAKIVSGTTFEVDGKIKNGDNKQHDIFVQVVLLDASGNQIATATKNVDNVPGNATVSFAIQGTTPQPTWQNVQVKVVNVTENVNGAGDD